MLLQFRDHFRHQRLVAARQRRDAQHVDVVLHRHARRFARRLEQRTDVHVEAQIGKRRGDHLGAAIVPVLAHLGDQDARPAAFQLRKLVGQSRAPSGIPGSPALSDEYTPEIVRLTA